MIASRVLTVLAAVLLVGAFALATMSDVDLPLAQALLQIDGGALGALHGAFSSVLSDAAWNDVAAPVLVRPVWLLPAMAGIVCCGLALSLRPRVATDRRGGRRRRR